MLVPHGYSLVLANSENDPDHEAALLAALRQRRLDGLIAAVADERAPGLAERLEGFAAVLFDRDVPGRMPTPSGRITTPASPRRSNVSPGSATAASRWSPEARASSGAARGSSPSGVTRAGSGCRSAGSSEAAEPGAARAASSPLASCSRFADPPTALMIGHNLLTVGVLEALSDLGVRLPGDLSVIACDDVDVTRLFSPPIDVIERDLLELGRALRGSCWSAWPTGTRAPRRVVLPTQLVTRGSTAAPRALTGARTA